MAIRLHTHLKNMVVKATMMGWTTKQIHERIDEILNIYGAKNKLPVDHKGNKTGLGRKE